MSTEENKVLVRRFYEDIWNRQDAATALELVSPAVVDHDHTPEMRVIGPESIMGLVTSFRAAIPDFRFTIQDMVAEADRVAVRWTMRGTHAGEFLGVAGTGRQLRGSGMHFFRVAQGKIAEIWVERDETGMMQQLGLI